MKMTLLSAVFDDTMQTMSRKTCLHDDQSLTIDLEPLGKKRSVATKVSLKILIRDPGIPPGSGI